MADSEKPPKGSVGGTQVGGGTKKTGTGGKPKPDTLKEDRRAPARTPPREKPPQPTKKK